MYIEVHRCWFSRSSAYLIFPLHEHQIALEAFSEILSLTVQYPSLRADCYIFVAFARAEKGLLLLKGGEKKRKARLNLRVL